MIRCYPNKGSAYSEVTEWLLCEFAAGGLIRKFAGSHAETARVWESWHATRSVSASETRGLAAPDTTASDAKP